MTVTVERLRFRFPSDWRAMKFDDTVFYRQQFGKMWEGIKAVDLIAVSPVRDVFMVEVKDYRLRNEGQPSDLPKIVAEKVLHTIGAQIAGKLRANEATEKDLFALVCRAQNLRVVLHIEQPPMNQGIFRPFDPANLQLKLRQLIKPIDPHPMVVNRNSLGNLPWTVTSLALHPA